MDDARDKLIGQPREVMGQQWEVVLHQQGVIGQLQAKVGQLEGRKGQGEPGKGKPKGMPGNKLGATKLPPEKAPRKNVEQIHRTVRESPFTARKISGGTRSAAGTETRMKLASMFGTWQAQGLNPFIQCLQLLTSPQP